MLQEFINQNYLIIEANVVTNIVVWDGDTTVWSPPAGSIAVVQATTPVMNWVWNVDTKTWSLQQEIGTGAIGYTWDGTFLTTNLPEPPPIKEAVQPTTEGTQPA